MHLSNMRKVVIAPATQGAVSYISLEDFIELSSSDGLLSESVFLNVNM